MTEEFKKTRGVEPAEIHIRDNPGQFKEWIKFRAGYITAFMEDVKAMIRGLETRLGRRIETMVRLPDDGFTANMIAGLDIVEWCERGLVDSVAVHPLQWIHGIWQHDAAPYVDIGRLTGVKVLGGVNMYPVERGFGQNPAAIARRILINTKRAWRISMYETNDSVTRLSWAASCRRFTPWTTCELCWPTGIGLPLTRWTVSTSTAGWTTTPVSAGHR